MDETRVRLARTRLVLSNGQELVVNMEPENVLEALRTGWGQLNVEDPETRLRLRHEWEREDIFSEPEESHRIWVNQAHVMYIEDVSVYP